jgi:hypothetical protein
MRDYSQFTLKDFTKIARQLDLLDASTPEHVERRA